MEARRGRDGSVLRPVGTNRDPGPGPGRALKIFRRLSRSAIDRAVARCAPRPTPRTAHGRPRCGGRSLRTTAALLGIAARGPRTSDRSAPACAPRAHWGGRRSTTQCQLAIAGRFRALPQPPSGKLVVDQTPRCRGAEVSPHPRIFLAPLPSKHGTNRRAISRSVAHGPRGEAAAGSWHIGEVGRPRRGRQRPVSFLARLQTHPRRLSAVFRTTRRVIEAQRGYRRAGARRGTSNWITVSAIR